MKTQSKLNSGLLGNWVIKIMAFMTALFLVMAIRFLNITARTVHIPLEIILDEDSDYIPISLLPETIDIVITGSDSIIYLVDPSQITAVADFSDVDSDGIVRKPVILDYDHDIYTQDGLTVEARPSTVRILFEEVAY